MILEWIKTLFSHSPVVDFFTPRVIVALVCGTIIGLERELFNKSAGMKTLMLVCLGSTLFATLSIFLGQSNGDPTRIIAQIVSGIGFLGAGVILQNKESGGVSGMTSAANIWFSGAIGCIIGVGEYKLGVLLSLVSVFFLITYRYFERFINKNYEGSMLHLFKLSVDSKPDVEIYSDLLEVIKSNGAEVKSSSLKKINGTSKKIYIEYSCQPKKHVNLFREVQKLNGIINLELDENSRGG